MPIKYHDQVSAVTEQPGVQASGATAGDLDDDEGGGLVGVISARHSLLLGIFVHVFCFLSWVSWDMMYRIPCKGFSYHGIKVLNHCICLVSTPAFYLAANLFYSTMPLPRFSDF